MAKLLEGTEYSAAILSKHDILYGNLIKVKKDVLPILDTYEEYDSNNTNKSLYIRKRIKAITENNKIVNAWIYLFNIPF